MKFSITKTLFKVHLLVITCINSLWVFGQQINEPLVCQNPTKELGISYISGGAFDINKYSCLTATKDITTHTVSSPSGIVPGSESYFFNFKDDSNLLQLSSVKKMDFNTPGKYWVLQQGTIGNKYAISCNLFEVIQTYIPDVEINTCGELNISVTFPKTLNNQSYEEFLIDWGDGTKETFSINANILPFSTPFHSFITKPIKLPVVMGNYKRNNATVCTTIAQRKINSKKVTTYISSLMGVSAEGSAKITLVNENSQAKYTIQYKLAQDSVWQDASEKPNFINNKAEINISNLNVNKQYCFRVKITLLNCMEEYYSNQVYTVSVKTNIESVNSVNLSWTTNNPIPTSIFNISIKDDSNALYQSATSTTNNFIYKSIDCKYKYFFTISYSYNQDSNIITISSAEILVNPKNIQEELPPILTTTISVDAQRLLIQPVLPINSIPVSYTFYRRETENSPFTEIGNSTTNNFIDTTVNPQEKQYCYRVQYKDACGFKSTMSPTFCSTYLTKINSTQLTWSTIEASHNNNIEKYYDILLLDENNKSQKVYTTNLTKINVFDIPVLSSKLNDVGNANIIIQASQKFEVDSLSEFIVSQHSNNTVIYMPLKIYAPNTFTPDGQGPIENEIFKVKGLFIKEFRMLIYDQWGGIVFETNNIENGWDGLLFDRKTPAPVSTYIYRVWCEDNFGNQLQKVGEIHLLR